MIISTEDIIINGLIEKNKINNERSISESEIIKYYQELIPFFNSERIIHLVSFNELNINAFFELYSNYFYKEIDNNNELHFTLKDNIDIEEFTNIFRNDISRKVLSIYSNEEILSSTFGKAKRIEFKKYDYKS